MFNDFININGIDIRCGYRRHLNDNFNFAYNIRSFATWRKLTSDYVGYEISFENYKTNQELTRSSDPVRNFSSTFDGEIIQSNGLDLILRPYNIFITRI
jgi:hypothetical protein